MPVVRVDVHQFRAEQIFQLHAHARGYTGKCDKNVHRHDSNRLVAPTYRGSGNCGRDTFYCPEIQGTWCRDNFSSNGRYPFDPFNRGPGWSARGTYFVRRIDLGPC